MFLKRARISLIPFLLATTAQTAAADKPWQGKVARALSGDTLTVQDRKVLVTVRLHGIDCPEMGQPHGEAARRFTSKRVSGKIVTIEPISEHRSGRVVARVYYPVNWHVDSRRPEKVPGPKSCLNDELLQAGLAWWDRKRAPKQEKLAKLEAGAKKAKRGLWKEKDPKAPWLWQTQHPPKLPWSKNRVCKRDSDCALLPRICPGCPPCEPIWRTPGNQKALKQIQSIQAKVRCRPHRCRPCSGSGSWLGTRAVCRKGQCAVAVPTNTGTRARGPLRGSVKSKILHWPGCKDYDCKSCNVTFKSVKAALKAGYQPHEACAEAPPPPSLPRGAHPKLARRYRTAPARPWSKDRLCTTDADCTLGPIKEPCTCRPCTPVWRPALNKAAHRAWKAKWATRKCIQRMVCPACFLPVVLGSKAVCVEGQCSVKP